jgi:diacylglycerol O-acyltransferase / wax synthase
MRESYYERLSALDQTFLAFETRNASMHVALTSIFEPGSLTTPQGGVDVERIRTHIAARLQLIPRYRQRLVYTPVTMEPIWVDDDNFDLGYHVRHASLPKPGGDRQLQRRCAEILERPLDRKHPLWEVWIIEGLSGGRFAMLSKVHHCMVDGIAGVDILAALLGTEPCPTVEEAEAWAPRQMPSERELLAAEMGRRTRNAFGLMREAVRHPRKLGRDLGSRLGAVIKLLGRLGRAPSTPFNQPIGPHRRVDWLAFELSTIKAIRNALGGTINDVVLTTVAGAVGKFLARRRVELGGEFRTVIPVSVRSADERGVPGNRVSVWLTALPVNERDPRRRLAAVRALTLQLKDDEDSLGAEIVTQAAEWTTANVINLAAQFINNTRFFNMIVTNVPGPPIPFYLLDAPMTAAYPHLPLFENQGLGIALFSYAGTLYWGVGADWNQMPDLAEFMREIAESFDELCTAAGVGVAAELREAAAVSARPPRLTVHSGSTLIPPAIPAAARGTAGRTRAASAADGLRRALPVPRHGRARSSRSTGRPAVPR